MSCLSRQRLIQTGHTLALQTYSWLHGRFWWAFQRSKAADLTEQAQANATKAHPPTCTPALRMPMPAPQRRMALALQPSYLYKRVEPTAVLHTHRLLVSLDLGSSRLVERHTCLLLCTANSTKNALQRRTSAPHPRCLAKPVQPQLPHHFNILYTQWHPQPPPGWAIWRHPVFT